MGRLVMTGSPLPLSVAFALISLKCATGASSVTDTPEGGVARAGRMIEAATTSRSALVERRFLLNRMRCLVSAARPQKHHNQPRQRGAEASAGRNELDDIHGAI